MIQLTQEELWMFGNLGAQLQTLQVEANRIANARDSYIKLLEGKYDATFTPQDGKFNKNEKKKVDGKD